MSTGSALLGGITGVVGLAGAYSEGKKADGSMSRARSAMDNGIASLKDYAEQAGVHGQDALDYAQSMVSDWENTYGGIEDNLSNYYNNLDPQKYAQAYKTDLNMNIDKQVAQLNETMAASGLQTAGMQQQTAKEAAFAKATGGAQADINAEDKVNSMKNSFLNAGMGQKAMANSSVINADNNLASLSMNTGTSLANAYNGKANLNQQQAGIHAADAAGYMKMAMDGFGMAAGSTSSGGASGTGGMDASSMASIAGMFA